MNKLAQRVASAEIRAELAEAELDTQNRALAQCRALLKQEIDDVVPLRDKVAALEAERDALRVEVESLRDGWEKTQLIRKEWYRECADADNILFASGLEEPHWRTDGGSLQVPRIVAHFNTLAKDADRYRWLRSHRPVSILSNLQMQPMPVGRPSWEHIDAAIDAAREKP